MTTQIAQQKQFQHCRQFMAVWRQVRLERAWRRSVFLIPRMCKHDAWAFTSEPVWIKPEHWLRDVVIVRPHIQTADYEAEVRYHRYPSHRQLHIIPRNGLKFLLRRICELLAQSVHATELPEWRHFYAVTQDGLKLTESFQPGDYYEYLRHGGSSSSCRECGQPTNWSRFFCHRCGIKLT